MATCAHLIFDTLGNAWTFYLFAFFCCLGGALFVFTLKEIQGLSRQEQMSLYSPSGDKYLSTKNQHHNDDIKEAEESDYLLPQTDKNEGEK